MISNQTETQDKRYLPFVLQGIEIHTSEELIKLCEVSSLNASEYLMRGDFENWFDYIDRKDLAQIAYEARNHEGSNEERLKNFVSNYKLSLEDLRTNAEDISEEVNSAKEDNFDANDEIDKQLKIISEGIQKYRDKLPEQRPPTILICGKIGNGKSTTINTLFGKEISYIGHFSRGTEKDEVYEWQAYSENINIVDLPGLGDSPKNDNIFQNIYRSRVKEADGYLVIVCPPRPAEDGTLKTVKLLIANGVSSKHIIFGYNKLSDLRYSDNGELKQVEMKGLVGPTSSSHIKAIRSAKEAFLTDLRREIPNASFSKDQIIEFDSISGWNLHKMLFAVIEILPFEALSKLKKVTDKAQEAVKKKEDEIITREKRLLDADRKRLDELNELYASRSDFEKQRKLIEQSIAEKEKNIEERITALIEFGNETNRLTKTVVGKVVTGVGNVVSAFDKQAGEAIIKAGINVQKVAEKVIDNVEKTVSRAANNVGKAVNKVADNVEKTVSKIGNWFKSWF